MDYTSRSAKNGVWDRTRTVVRQLVTSDLEYKEDLALMSCTQTVECNILFFCFSLLFALVIMYIHLLVSSANMNLWASDQSKSRKAGRTQLLRTSLD